MDTARPELADAIIGFRDAYDALVAADVATKIVWDLFGEWERKNPRPGWNTRAYRKWLRRHDKYMDEIGYDAPHNAWAAAQREYRDAQMRLAQVQAVTFDEIALKATASMAFEGGLGDKDRLPLRGHNQMVAFGVALDCARLAYAAEKAAAVH